MQIYVGKPHLNGSQDNSLCKCSWAVLSEKVSRHEPALNVLLLSGCSCKVIPCFKSPLPWLLCHDGLHPWTVSQIAPFLPDVDFVTILYPSDRKVTKTLSLLLCYQPNTYGKLLGSCDSHKRPVGLAHRGTEKIGEINPWPQHWGPTYAWWTQSNLQPLCTLYRQQCLHLAHSVNISL